MRFMTKDTGIQLAQIRPLAWDLLSLISSLVGISAFFILAIFLALTVDSLPSLIPLPKWIGDILSIFVQLFVWLMFGICVSRYLGRIDPLRAASGQQLRAAWLKTSIIIAYILFLLLPRNTPGRIELLALAAFIPVGASLLERYASISSSSLDEPFVLFLRGFRGSAERSVVPSVLDAIPHGRRIVFLIPRFSGPAYWDPHTICLSGFRLFQPLRSMPVYISATSEQWVEVVVNLIRRAESIVIDLSRDSPAIRTELQLVASEGRMREAILIDPTKDSPADEILQAQIPPDAKIAWLRLRYRTTFRSASLRMLSGMALMSMLTFIFVLMLGVISPWFSSRMLEGFVIFYCMFTMPFYLKPLVAQDFRQSLKRILSSFPRQEPFPLPNSQTSEDLHNVLPLREAPFAHRIGRQGVTGVYFCTYAVLGLFIGTIFSSVRTDLSPFWQTAFQILCWTTLLAGVLNIVQGVLSVRTRRAGLGWMSSDSATDQHETKGVRAEIRQIVFQEWIDRLADLLDNQLSWSLALALLTAACVLIDVTILLWTIFFFILSFLAFFALGDLLGSFIARHRLLLNLSTALPTDAELRQLLEHNPRTSAREDMELVFVRYRVHRKVIQAPSSRPLLTADEVIGQLQSIEASRINWWLWLLGLLISAILGAITFEDPWAAILGALAGLGYGLPLAGFRRFLKRHVLQRRLYIERVTLEDYLQLINYIGQRTWKNKDRQKTCREILLLSAARETAIISHTA